MRGLDIDGERTLWRWLSQYSKTGILTGKCHGGGFSWIFEDEHLAEKAGEWCQQKSKQKGGLFIKDFKEYLQSNSETNMIHNEQTIYIWGTLAGDPLASKSYKYP